MNKIKIHESELRTLIRGILVEFIDPGTVLASIVGPEIFAGIGPQMGGIGDTLTTEDEDAESEDEVLDEYDD